MKNLIPIPVLTLAEFQHITREIIADINRRMENGPRPTPSTPDPRRSPGSQPAPSPDQRFRFQKALALLREQIGARTPSRTSGGRKSRSAHSGDSCTPNPASPASAQNGGTLHLPDQFLQTSDSIAKPECWGSARPAAAQSEAASPEKSSRIRSTASPNPATSTPEAKA